LGKIVEQLLRSSKAEKRRIRCPDEKKKGLDKKVKGSDIYRQE